VKGYDHFMIENKLPFDTNPLQRPAPGLLTYYILGGLLTGPACIFVIPALFIRYNTLRYRFEETGVRMQVGWFFRKEVVVAFRRIQDIHVSRNIVQRWLGISTVSVQTASGNATPEIIFEGVTDPDGVRDWLYSRMRGAKGQTPNQKKPSDCDALDAQNELHGQSTEDAKNVTRLLEGIRDNLAVLVEKNTLDSGSAS
jgi:uncharacterized protein